MRTKNTQKALLEGWKAVMLGATDAPHPQILVNQYFRVIWCGREDSNLHGSYPTATSTLRVYQFRHDRI